MVVTVSGIAEIDAEVISIRWRSTDFEVVDWYALQSGTNNNTLPTQPSDKTSLSGAVIAGIVLGSLAGLMLAAIGVLFFCRRARRYQQAATKDSFIEQSEHGMSLLSPGL
jgi:hypothetical protein